MRRFVLMLAVAAPGLAAPGCGTLLSADGRRTTGADSIRTLRRDMAAGWEAARMRFDRMREEMRQDLLLHEDEGLEDFGPGSLEQVQRMRREMRAEGEFAPER